MPATEIDWISPAVALLIGVIAGVVLFLSGRSKAKLSETAATKDDDRRRQFDSLIAQLREMQDAGSTVAAEDRSAEQRRLEIEAATLLREIDASAPAVSAPAPVATPSRVPGFFEARPALRRMVWATTAAAVAAVTYVALLQTAKPREAGGTLTGNLPDRGGNASASTADPALASLLQRVESEPNDLNARNDLAKAFLERQDLMSVFQQTDFVLRKDPNNARALAYQSLVRLAIGNADEAREMVTRAIERDPNLLDAWLHLAIIHLQSGNAQAALQTLQVARQRHPEAAEMLDNLEREMRQRLAAGSGSPSAAVSSTPPRAAASSEDAISGEIRLAPGLNVVSGSVIFLTIREAGSRLGAPIAAQRLPVAEFPMKFSIGQEHSMQGRPFPAQARIEARIDTDGNPLTKEPGDLVASADEIAKGTSNVTLTLAPPSL